MVNTVNFMFCAFYHDKKKKKETNQEDSHMNREEAQVPLGRLPSRSWRPRREGMSPGEWVELKEKQLLLEIPPKALGEIPWFLSPPILQSSASTSC